MMLRLSVSIVALLAAACATQQLRPSSVQWDDGEDAFELGPFDSAREARNAAHQSCPHVAQVLDVSGENAHTTAHAVRVGYSVIARSRTSVDYYVTYRCWSLR